MNLAAPRLRFVLVGLGTLALSACAFEAGEESVPTDLATEEATAEAGEAAVAAACGSPGVRCGLTWVKSQHDNTRGQDTVSCHDGTVNPSNSCDPYVGDTDCNLKRPILCIRQDGSASNGFVGSFYNGWASGNINITRPILGTALSSLAAADAECVNHFGAGWRMAEHHDGNGGWSWTAYGNLNDLYTASDPSHTLNRRFWVHINDQPGNCWD